MRRVAAIAVLACLPMSALLADVYRSVDAQGHVLYSDTPTPGAERVQVTGAQQRNFTAAASSPSRSTAVSSERKFSSAQSDEQIKEQLAHEQAARSVANDVAQTRAEQCKKAQDAYDKSVQARRIYNEDNNGNRQYLSDDEAQQARVSAKLTMDQLCKG
jgi:hypothetical protein